MRIMKIAAGVVVGILVASGIAFAQQNEKGGAFSKKDFKEAMREKLGITQEQHQQLESNRQLQEETVKGLREAIKQQRGKLQQALKDPQTTRESVEPIVAQMKALQGQLIDQRVNAIFTAKTILTPEQFAQFNEMAGKHSAAEKGRMRERSKQRKGTWLMKGDDDLFGGPPFPPPQEE